jgi:ABC-2 type transport system ATP-binding protein
MHAVELDNVTKHFGTHTAVDNLSLRVPVGSVYGFIGPNGSGKTTTLRIIMRIFYPNSGSVRVLGQDVIGSGPASDRVGYLPEERGLYRNMKVREILRFHAELKGFRRSGTEITKWLDRMGLSDWSDKKVEALSKGMAQKVQIIAAVIAKPELIILDEPFTGLDPVNTDLLRDVILELRRDGTTIILSTHDMAVAEKMCDAVFMIFRGKKVLDGSLDEITAEYATDTVRTRVDTNGQPLDTIAGVSSVTDFGQYQELRLERDTNSQTVLEGLMKRGVVRHFELTKPSLHDIFVRIARPGSDATEINDA